MDTLTDVQWALTHLIEEAAEVQQAATKILLYGVDNWHPETGLLNKAKLRDELLDLVTAIGHVHKLIELRRPTVEEVKYNKKKFTALRHVSAPLED